MLLLETNGEACVHGLMGVSNVEAAVSLSSILPDDVDIAGLRCPEQFVEEVRNGLACVLQMLQALAVVPTEDILETAAFEPQFVRLFLLEDVHIHVCTNGLGAGTLLNLVDVGLG